MNGQNVTIQSYSGTNFAATILNAQNFLNNIDKSNVVSVNITAVGTAAAPRYIVTILYIA